MDERDHAALIIAFWDALEGLEERSEIFVRARDRYGSERGRRMARRASKDGRSLDGAAYRDYGEISHSPSNTVGFQNGDNSMVTRCPWHDSFVKSNHHEAGRLWCQGIDLALGRGFAGYRLEVHSTLHESDACRFVFPGAARACDPQPRFSWRFHCAHLYHSFRATLRECLNGPEADRRLAVLERFEIRDYSETDYIEGPEEK